LAENEEIIKLDVLRKTMIKNLYKSTNVAAQSSVVIEINMSNFEKAKEDLTEEVEKVAKIKLTYLPMLIYIISRVLIRHPILNSTLDLEKEEIIRKKNINLGFAVAVERKNLTGLIIPVIHEANKKKLKEIVIMVKQLVDKAIKGTISIEEISGGTFTISSVGNFGVDLIQPLLRFPEDAILGVTRIKYKPIVIDGSIQIAPLSNFCITVDHRIIDGVPTYRFLEDLKDTIEMINANDFIL
jgi:pyruvate dehydrogenase E2 component (dihydrolipoamide acetyltransferase)